MSANVYICLYCFVWAQGGQFEALRPIMGAARLSGWRFGATGGSERAQRAAYFRERALESYPPRPRWRDILIEREEARRVLEAYASSQVTAMIKGATPGPLVFLGDAKSPLAHVGTLKKKDDGRSAYHIARAIHEAVIALEAKSLTVLMFAYKVIQGIKYQGFMLYHVDEEGNKHTRILDPHTGHHWILDGSRFWRPFPYTFGDGPHPMPAILGRHDDNPDPQTPEFDELLRP